MDLYPAIDVQGGRVARAPDRDPVAVAHQYARDGARWIHFVDLDRALGGGRGENRGLACRVLAESPIPVQVGGGFVAETEIGEALTLGARRVIIGGAAAMDGALVARLIARHGAERLAVGIDARDGRVAPRGSSTVLDVSPLELAKRLLAAGVRTIVYTDAARDGALAGADVPGARAIAALGFDVIVSGGVASLDDLRRARDARLAGAIVGRALHEGRFTLPEALACLAG
ncbi:MAG TPA: 1-(5-phosphoribosyl)-5-[(5-phosphoribosylamino)methylideneamino] imidazole-4-carboxamide isomerase [Gemmatimonadales bacterium]|nr:1-(5-phosphoribosyl)-5-[(5-phosphoribosylamino)methylideneamino] imidazole-4-carboxamide isomerase [Gemmatimonadales bacterium]